MPRLDANDVACHVYTFKEGLLSRVAHDLLLRVERLDVQVDEESGRVEASFEAASLQVVCAMKAGHRDERALSERDRREIQRNLARDVLRVERHPTIRYVAGSVRLDDAQVRGQLMLCGKSKDVTGSLRSTDGRIRAVFELDQRDFGIRPFSAMLGALKIKAQVRVEIDVAANALVSP